MSNCVCSDPCNPCSPIYDFTSEITSLTDLIPSPIQFSVRRKNKVVTLQWEHFNGTLSEVTEYLSLIESINPNILPQYTMSFPVIYALDNISRVSYFWINPTAIIHPVRFYLNLDSSSSGILAGMTVIFTGGSVSWIIS